MRKPSTPTQERVRQLFRYDPNTGAFTWRVAKVGRGGRGGVAAGDTAGAWGMVKIDQRRHRVTRLIWLYMTGQVPLPGYYIRHLDGDSKNNRWSNLSQETKKSMYERMDRSRSYSTWKKVDAPLTAKRLRQLLDYDPERGLFTWKVTTGPSPHFSQQCSV